MTNKYTQHALNALATALVTGGMAYFGIIAPTQDSKARAQVAQQSCCSNLTTCIEKLE